MEYGFLFKNVLFMAPLLCFSGGSETFDGVLKPIQKWPKYEHFGQISAVGVDDRGNVYVFHRGNRKWDANTFEGNKFVDKDKGAIPEETIVVLEPGEGTLLKKTGTNLFFLPHGLTVDDENNVWVTDVALHQVFKFPPIDISKPNGELGKASLTLGVPFEPGNDDGHFCKPTGVAVDKQSKEFYISDGYCNSRIVKFDQFGNHMLSFGRSSVGAPYMDPYMLNIPHAVVLAEDTQTLYVVDRENLRVLSYDSQFGKFKKSFAQELRSRIFSVAYSALEGGLLFVLTNDVSIPKSVAIYSANSGKLLNSFHPENSFTNPHDLALSPDGQFCYVVELNPYKIWKFKLDLDPHSPKSPSSSEKPQKPTERIEEPLPAESKIDRSINLKGSNSFLAWGLVFSIVAFGFIILLFHMYYKKGGYRGYESRRLILDDDENGIRLT